MHAREMTFRRPVSASAPSGFWESIMIALLVATMMFIFTSNAEAYGNKAACVAAAPGCDSTCDAVAEAADKAEALEAVDLAASMEAGCSATKVKAYINGGGKKAPPPPPPAASVVAPSTPPILVVVPARTGLPPPPKAVRTGGVKVTVLCEDGVTQVEKGQEATCPQPTYGCDPQANLVPAKDNEGGVVWENEAEKKAQCACADGFEEVGGYEVCLQKCQTPTFSRSPITAECVSAYLATAEGCLLEGKGPPRPEGEPNVVYKWECGEVFSASASVLRMFVTALLVMVGLMAIFLLILIRTERFNFNRKEPKLVVFAKTSPVATPQNDEDGDADLPPVATPAAAPPPRRPRRN